MSDEHVVIAWEKMSLEQCWKTMSALVWILEQDVRHHAPSYYSIGRTVNELGRGVAHLRQATAQTQLDV